MQAITTYHHPHHCPPGHAVPGARIGDTPPHAAHIAGLGPHTRFRDCVGRPVTVVGRDHANDLHLDGHNHRFGNHPHSGLLRGPNSARFRRTAIYPVESQSIPYKFVAQTTHLMIVVSVVVSGILTLLLLLLLLLLLFEILLFLLPLPSLRFLFLL